MNIEGSELLELGGVRHALLNANIRTLSDIAARTEEQLLELHGVRGSDVRKMRASLIREGMVLAG